MRRAIIERPKLAARFLLTGADAAAVRPFATGETMETAASFVTSTVVIQDSEDFTASTHVYQVETPNGRIAAYQDSASAPSATCGDQIRLEGFRLGDVMLVTEATVIRAADRQPNCQPIGERRVAVLMLNMPGLPALRLTPEDVRRQFFDPSIESVAAFYAENSYGLASVSGDVYGPFNLSRAFQCSEPSNLLAEAIRAADSTVDFTRYTHVHLLHPNLPGGCGWHAQGSVGCESITSPSKGPLRMAHVVQNVTTASVVQTASHEIGHNFGAGHARSIEFPGETLGPDRSHAIYTEYGDRFSVMGSGSLSHFAAPHKFQFSWLKEGHEVRTVSSDAEVTIAPLTSPGDAVKALRVRRNLGRGKEWVWIEYRQRSGFDGGMTATGWNGAMLHYQTAETGVDTEAIDFSPRPPGSAIDSFNDVVIAPGRKWADPYSDLTIEVVSTALDGMRVRVRYEPPCAKVAWPSSASIDGAGEILTARVTAGPGCALPVSANNFWIAAGDAPGVFSVSSNSTALPRSGSVTVARQTFFFKQASQSGAPHVVYVAPASGSVAAGTATTFTATVSSPGGTFAIGAIDLALGPPGERSGCAMRFDYPTRKLALFNDAGDQLLSGSLQNARCSVSSPTFVSVNSTTLQVSANVTFVAGSNGHVAISAGAASPDTRTTPSLQPRGEVTVTSSCVPSLSVRRFEVSGSGGSFGINVTGCSWVAPTGVARWLSVSATATQLRVTVAANPDVTPRSTELRVLDAVIAVAQAAKGMPVYPAVEFESAEIRLPRTSGSGYQYFSTNISAAGLRGEVDAGWLHVDSLVIDSFRGPTLNYSYDANRTGRARTAAIVIAGVPLFFSQDAGSGGREYRIDTFAGSGDIGDQGPATDAFLDYPTHIAYDPDGNLFIAEAGASRIRKVTRDGKIATLAVPGREIRGLAVDRTGRILFSEPDRVRAISSDGALTTLANGLSNASGIAVDTSGNVYFAETNTHRVGIVSVDGKVSWVVGTGAPGYSGDGRIATSAQLRSPTALALSTDGSLYISDTGNYAVRQVSGGSIRTIAGTGRSGITTATVLATQAALGTVASIAVNNGGQVYFADSGRIRTIDAGGMLVTVAGNAVAFSTTPAGLAFSPAGQLAFTDPDSRVVREIVPGDQPLLSNLAGRELSAPMGDGGPATAARLYRPQAVALAPDGSLYLTDTNNHRVRRVTTNGSISTVAGTGVPGSSGDGSPATAATLRAPTGIAVDSIGNVFVSDSGNSRIRKIAPDGTITTVAANLLSPQGLAVHGSDLYIAEFVAQRVRKLTPGGMLSTVAGTGQATFTGDGGQATAAALRGPTALAFDASGNLYISDTGNYRIRRVAPDGTISTVAGNGIALSDSIFAANRSMGNIYGLAVDVVGNLWFADTARSLVGRVSPEGTVTIEAGGVAAGFSGDGAAAWAAQLNTPAGLTADANGRVMVVDSGNHRVRVLTPVPD
jgi:M6 family metalloprotease-like protein